MANRSKNDGLAYDWVPEVMTTIDPAPAYVHNGYPKLAGTRLTTSRRAAEGAAAFRNSLTNVQQKQERSRVGRLFAHFKLLEMRRHIKEARTKEGKYNPDDELDPADRAKALLNAEKTSATPTVKIDDELNLPYGFGYDQIIKERADLVNDKKFLNN